MPILKFWDKLGIAALSAMTMDRDGRTVWVGNNIAFSRIAVDGHEALRIHMPCGRSVYYGHAQVVNGCKVIFRPVKKPGMTDHFYGGRLANAVAQGACASPLRQKLVQCQDAGLRIVAHVHDSITCETPKTLAQTTANQLREIMMDAPTWAQGLTEEVRDQISISKKVAERRRDIWSY